MILEERIKNVIENEFAYNVSDKFNFPGIKKVEIVLVDFLKDGYKVIGKDTIHKEINDDLKKDLEEIIKNIDENLEKYNSLSLDTQTLILTFENGKVLSVYSSEWLSVGIS